MKFEVRLPITNNHSHRLIRIGRRNVRVPTEETKAWMDECRLIAKNAMQKHGWETATTKTIVNLWFYFKDNRNRDSHNGLKLLLDAMEQAGVFVNDRLALPRIQDYYVDKSIEQHFIIVEVMLKEQGE